MARRGTLNSKKRPVNTLAVRPVVYICAEGTTEAEYFKHFGKLQDRFAVNMVRKGSANAPNKLVERMSRHLGTGGLCGADLAAIVCDVDSWTAEQFDALFKWQQSSSQHLAAISNPFFELWLILHFDDCRSMSNAELNREIQRHIPTYKKHLDGGTLKRLEQGIDDAISRARTKRTSPQLPVDQMPTRGTTTVYELMEKIR